MRQRRCKLVCGWLTGFASGLRNEACERTAQPRWEQAQVACAWLEDKPASDLMMRALIAVPVIASTECSRIAYLAALSSLFFARCHGQVNLL
jgi:hypothetical protein